MALIEKNSPALTAPGEEAAASGASAPAAEKKTGGGFDRFYTARFYRILYGLEKIFGVHVLPIITGAMVAAELLRRRRDYPQFLRLRHGLPTGFWKGVSPLRHFVGMVYNWDESMMQALFYPCLARPDWQRRFEVRGTPPNKLPEWGQRPVIVTFLHMGHFGVMRWWLRANGIPAASLLAASPAIVDNPHYNKYLEAGDELCGLKGFPHIFKYTRTGIRDVIRFLKPGRALTMALDGGPPSPESDRQDAGGIPIYLKKGACRIAAQTNSVILPMSIRRTGWCRWTVHFGAPVPDELLQKDDLTEANQHLFSELWPDLQAHPENLTWSSLEAFNPSLIGPRGNWP